MLTRSVPIQHAGRGRSLEYAVLSSCEIYRKRGLADVHKMTVKAGQRRDGSFYRAPSLVDFMGGVRGISVAFDAKQVRDSCRLDKSKVPAHQLAFLRDHAACGNVAALLVEFVDRAVFFASYEWLAPLFAQRQSIRLEAFDAAAICGGGVSIIQPGVGGVPIPFVPAVHQLYAQKVHS